jgi:signal transduction histidine kinase
MTDGAKRSALIVVAPEEAVERAYDSARSSFDELRGGLGLALPIARRVIERHGGTIWSPIVDPTAARTAHDPPGRGALVVALPLRE